MSLILTYRYGLRHSRNILLIYFLYLALSIIGLIVGNQHVSCIAFISCGIVCAIYKVDWKYTHNYIGLLLIAKDENNPKVMLGKFTGALYCRIENNKYVLQTFEKRIHSVDEDIADVYNLRSYIKSSCNLTSFYNLVAVITFGVLFVVACWVTLNVILYWLFTIFILFTILDNLLTTYALTEVVLRKE